MTSTWAPTLDTAGSTATGGRFDGTKISPSNAAVRCGAWAAVALATRASATTNATPLSATGRSRNTALRSKTGRAAHATASATNSANFVANSVPAALANNALISPMDAPNSTRPRGDAGIVCGSVIMKKRKINTSGEVTRIHQYDPPLTVPTCHRAVIA